MHEEDPQIDGMAKLLRLVSQDQNKTVLANHIKQNYAGNTTLGKKRATSKDRTSSFAKNTGFFYKIWQ